MTRAAAPRATRPTARPVRSAPARKAPAARPSPLRERRKKQQKRGWVLLLILFLVLLGIIVYVLWLPALRVQAIEAEGPDPEGIEAVALAALEGSALGVLPRSSIFLVPEEDIRARVLDAYPQVQAVSVSATGLTTLSVKALARDDAFVWCGESPAARRASCYKADAEGLIFAPYEVPVVGTTTASSSPAIADGDLVVYGAIEGESDSPVRSHVAYASALPDALKFIKAMRGLGADIVSVTLRSDEIDLHTEGGTRITYVIGKEGEAAILAATSFPDLDVNDGSIEYVDLRFQNKVYLKRVGE